MMESKSFDSTNKPTHSEKKALVKFLSDHLEHYGDPKEDIQRAIDFSLQEFTSFGGFSLRLSEDGIIKGVVIINQTGMAGYIPENILVYIAIHKNHRGQGLGKKLMQMAIDQTDGDIALHVEADNPARFLYEKMGFTNPYLEMRLKK